MLSAVRALIATVLIALAAPAAALAQDPVPAPEPIVAQGGVVPAPDPTVGPGQVVTDPASETEPAPTAGVPAATDGVAQELPADQPKRGEVHVLGGATASSTPPAAAASPAQAAAPVARTASGGRKTLPFTGVDAGALALVGLGLLAAGSGLLAVLRQPVQ
jgi:hypothetical protein